MTAMTAADLYEELEAAVRHELNRSYRTGIASMAATGWAPLADPEHAHRTARIMRAVVRYAAALVGGEEDRVEGRRRLAAASAEYHQEHTP